MPSRHRLQTSSLSDALYDALRMRIINGEIDAGERLTEARVASEFVVARPTAKACLERLIAAGLLHRTAGRTAVVPSLGPEELADLFIAREAVEHAAVTRLAGTGAVPHSARIAQEAIEAAAAAHRFRDQVVADIAFHSALVEAAGSARLIRMHGLIMGEVHLTMGQFRAHRSTDPSTVVAEHAAIMQAIDGGSAADASAALRTHLDHARDRLVARARGAQEPALDADPVGSAAR